MPRSPGAETAAHPLAAAILARARRLLGTPFRHQGRVPGRGLDCVGLALVVARELGLSAYDWTGYPRLPQPRLLFAHAVRAGFRRKPVERAAGGDLLVMRFHDDPCHVAIATEGACGVIHACARRGRVVEHRLDRRWRARIVDCFVFPLPSVDPAVTAQDAQEGTLAHGGRTDNTVDPAVTAQDAKEA